MKVTKPVPTTHKLSAKRLSFNEESIGKATDDATILSESFSEKSSEIMTKAFTRPNWELKEEDEFEEY